MARKLAHLRNVPPTVGADSDCSDGDEPLHQQDVLLQHTGFQHARRAARKQRTFDLSSDASSCPVSK